MAKRFGPIANVVEVAREGAAAPFTYRKVDVELDPATNAASAPDSKLLYQEDAPARRPDPFALLIKSDRPAISGDGQRIVSLPEVGSSMALPVRGVPINVSKAAETPPPRIEHIAVMPERTTGLGALLAAANVEESQRGRLIQALAMDTFGPPNRLELLLDRPVLRDVGARVLAARIQWGNGSAVAWAPDDKGVFHRLKSDLLFDRLSREADVVGFVPARPSSEDVDKAVAHASLPIGHLMAEGTPLPVAEQIVDLARKSGFSFNYASSDDQPLVLLFRTKADGQAELVSVTFPDASGSTTFYRFRPSPGAQPEFFDTQGRSVSKMLLHKPVPNGRLGDGFAWRLHPILKRWLHHNGVDYDAPYGSPILAAGDGTVVIIGHEWGYGKYVRIRHDAGYFTTYAHISGIPASLKVGEHVKQGQVIAYIGSTGLSTGPHLYYELRVDGRYYDPLKAKLPAGTMLTGESLQDFRRQIQHVDRIDRYIEATTAKAGAIRTPSAGGSHRQAAAKAAPDAG